MIQTKDLRQGNKLKFEDKIVTVLYITPDGVIIDGIDAADGSNISLEQERLEYIPLDETWLERCGFDKFEQSMLHFIYRDYRRRNCVVIPVAGFCEVEYSGLSIDDRTHIGRIQYVHQLQNLFYALCGEELEIK